MSRESQMLQELVQSSGVRKVNVVAWRDLDDPEAGGSELHADEILRRWAAAGLVIESRTSAVAGYSSRIERHGYTINRRGGRYQIFPDAIFRGLFSRRANRPDAVVEIWNGMPFFSPIWYRGRRLVLLHHVHGEMWQMTLPGLLGRVGWIIEHWLAPPFYRRTTIATLSNSSRDEIKERMHLHRIEVVPPGISTTFLPGGERSASPLVVAVGRLVPVKRFDLLIESFIEVRKAVPSATFVIVGDGYLRTELEELIASHAAQNWISLPGRITDEELLSLYQRAWLVSSASLREGWGMSLTEAAACGTPSVVVDIAGHRDAVDHGHSGLLVDKTELAMAISNVLRDDGMLERLRLGAFRHAQNFTWDSAALDLFRLILKNR